MNPVIRQEDGSLLLSLPHAEGLVLCSMPQRIEALLSREGFNRRVVERLFPIAYEDSSREAEYRKLLGDDLRRSSPACTCRADAVGPGNTGPRGGYR